MVYNTRDCSLPRFYTQLREIDRPGLASHPLRTTALDLREPKWSADETKLVAVSFTSGGIVVLQADGAGLLIYRTQPFPGLTPKAASG